MIYYHKYCFITNHSDLKSAGSYSSPVCGSWGRWHILARLDSSWLDSLIMSLVNQSSVRGLWFGVLTIHWGVNAPCVSHPLMLSLFLEQLERVLRESKSTQSFLSSMLRTGHQFHLILVVKASHEVIPENRPHLMMEGAVRFYHNYWTVKLCVHCFACIYHKHLLCAGHCARPGWGWLDYYSQEYIVQLHMR